MTPEQKVGISIAVAFCSFLSYMVGVDHANVNLQLAERKMKEYKAIASQPCIRAGQIKAIVYDYARRRK